MLFENTSTELHPAPTEAKGLNDFNRSQTKPVTGFLFCCGFFINQYSIPAQERISQNPEKHYLIFQKLDI